MPEYSRKNKQDDNQRAVMLEILAYITEIRAANNTDQNVLIEN